MRCGDCVSIDPWNAFITRVEPDPVVEHTGPLAGRALAVKDLFDTAGIRTSWGAVPCRDRIPEGDATVVARLRRAGAVLLGKLAMVEFAGGLGYRWADASAAYSDGGEATTR